MNPEDSSALQKLVPLLQRTNELLEQTLVAVEKIAGLRPATPVLAQMVEALERLRPATFVVEQGVIGWPADKVVKCDKPPAGWTCSRPGGHEGPCAASRVTR